MLLSSSVDASIAPDVIRAMIANAYQKFKAVNYNVREFSDWIMQLANQLAQQGATSTDIRTHILIALESSPDEAFRSYIIHQKDEIFDNPDKEYPYELLLARAQDKYDRLGIQRTMNTIIGPPTEEPIMALQTQINELKKQLGQKQESISDGTSADNKERKGKRYKDKPFREKPPGPWRGIPTELKSKDAPKDITKPIDIDGTKYWYCPVHSWCPHPFENQGDVKGCFYNVKNQSAKESDEKDDKPTETTKPGNRNGRVVRAYQALVEKTQGSGG